MTKVIVQESATGKFGPYLKLSDGSFLNFGKFYKGTTAFEPGTELLVDMFVSDKGGKWANAITIVEKRDATKKGRRDTDNEVNGDVPTIPPAALKQRDFDKENRGKVRSLFVEALLSNPVVTNELKLDAKKVEAFLEPLVEYVFK